jgi:hypothetical protein
MLVEGGPFIAPQQRGAEADLAIAAAKLRGHMRDLEPAGLSFPGRASKQAESLQEE